MKKLLTCLLILSSLLSGCGDEPADNNKTLSKDETSGIKGKIGKIQYETNPVVFKIKSVPQGTWKWYDALIEIKNTGDLPINLWSTKLAVEDSDGKLITVDESSAVLSYPKVIMPDEVGYISATYMEFPENCDPSLEYHLKFDSSCITQANNPEFVDCEVTDVSFPDGDYSRMIGRIINNSDKNLILLII